MPGYRLTDQTYKKLKAKGLHDFINDRLHSPKIKEFLDENQYKAALNAKIDDLINHYQSQIEKHAEKLATYKLTDLSLDKLSQELKTK